MEDEIFDMEYVFRKPKRRGLVQYWTCPECGANLDCGEKCDCGREEI